MSPHYFLDANTCIYAASERFPRIAQRFNSLVAGEAQISVIVYGELMFGVQKSDRPDAALRRLEALVAVAPVVPLHEDAACEYGSIRAELERAGTPIGNNDLWIAAHARAAGLILVTNNEREFRRVPKLRVENWAAK